MLIDFSMFSKHKLRLSKESIAVLQAPFILKPDDKQAPGSIGVFAKGEYHQDYSLHPDKPVQLGEHLTIHLIDPEFH